MVFVLSLMSLAAPILLTWDLLDRLGRTQSRIAGNLADLKEQGRLSGSEFESLPQMKVAGELLDIESMAIREAQSHIPIAALCVVNGALLLYSLRKPHPSTAT